MDMGRALVATQALRKKKMLETQLDSLYGTRLQLEMQVNTLESAIFNQETMAAMKQGADVLKAVHGNLFVSPLSSCSRRASSLSADRCFIVI